MAVCTLPVIAAQNAGFSAEALVALDNLIHDSVRGGFPGAVLAITRNGYLVKLSAYGYAKRNDENGPLAQPQPMSTDTLFDLASNTKLYATTYALQHLVWQEKLKLNTPIHYYLPDFIDDKNDVIKGKSQVTVEHLLRHSSGALANPLYYDRTWNAALFSQNRQTTYQKLQQTPLAFIPNTQNVYSDLGFMLLGRIIECVSGLPLETYVERYFYAPLGLRALYAPLRGNARLHGFMPEEIAATETQGNTRDGSIFFDNIRTHTLQGQVQDEKAFYSLEEVAGHAGLFADAYSVAVLQQLMLNGGNYNNQLFFDQKTINRFTAPPSTLDASFGLGWRLNVPGLDQQCPSFFGRYASQYAIGHTGWTGTATLIDPQYKLTIVFLTNKKNTPVINPQLDSHYFLGDTFPISLYYRVMEHVYKAMNAPSF